MSDTPRTDTVAFGTDDESLNRLFGIRELPRYVAPADFARQLERELAAVTAERDALKDTALERLAKMMSHSSEQLIASQQEARRLREALDAIMASAKVAYCATTDPMMTDALVGIGKRCKDAVDAELAKEGK